MITGKYIDHVDTEFEIYDDETVLIGDDQKDKVVIPVKHLRFILQQADTYLAEFK